MIVTVALTWSVDGDTEPKISACPPWFRAVSSVIALCTVILTGVVAAGESRLPNGGLRVESTICEI